MGNLVKSVSYDEQEIIKNILSLHCNGPIQLDATYSKGNFYKGWSDESIPKYKFDINPVLPNVLYGDSRHLPIESESIKTIMFDPPFLATSGPSLKKNDGSNKINKRFSVYNSEKELHQFYVSSLKESYRILSNNGILIFKCQDKVSSGKQYLSHVFIINEAIKTGFYCKDLFILLAQNRIVADWQKVNQKNARKFHCYFLVLQKANKRIEYL